MPGTSEVPFTLGSPAANPPGGLSAKEKQIHEWGLVSILQRLHDDPDTAFAAPVTAVYGRRTTKRVQQISDVLETLTMLGHAQEVRGRYTAV